MILKSGYFKLIGLQSSRLLKLKPFGAFILSVVVVLGFFGGGPQLPHSLAEAPAVTRNGASLEAPFLVKADEGTVWNIFGLEIVGKVMSDQTQGKYAVVISTTPPGGGPPLHVH